MQQQRATQKRTVRAAGAWLVLSIALLAAFSCAPSAGPSPTPMPTGEPIELPTASPTPTATRPDTQVIEGLLMIEEGQLIIGVDWLSKSRVTYRVTGGDLDGLRELEGKIGRAHV